MINAQLPDELNLKRAEDGRIEIILQKMGLKQR